MWIASVPGADKTSLVSQYLEERKLPYLWYRLVGDGRGWATFFDDLGRGVSPSRRHREPDLLVRRYFEAMGSLLPKSSVVVLDELHEPDDSTAISRILMNGVELLKPSQMFMVLSRRPPPKELIRLQEDGALLLEVACAGERDDGSSIDQLLAWSGSVAAIVAAYDDMSLLDEWISAFEAMAPNLDELPLPIATTVLASWLSALNYRRIDDPGNDRWIDLAIRLLGRTDLNPKSALLLGYVTESNRWWMGDESKARVVHDLLGRVLRETNLPAPLAVHRKVVEAWFALSTGDYAACLRAVAEGQELAQRHGIVLWDFILGGLGAFGALFQENVHDARSFLDALSGKLPVGNRRLEAAQVAYLMAWLSLLEGNVGAAVEHGRRGAEDCSRLGTAFPEALCRLVLAQAHAMQRDAASAAKEAARAATLVPNSRLLRTHQALIAAQVALYEGRRLDAEAVLREVLGQAKEHGLSCLLSFSARSEVVAELCMVAFEADIEPSIAYAWLQRRPCSSFTPPPTLERWPWRVRVLITSTFDMEVDGKPLPSHGKPQARPLELLQRLAVAGPHGLSESRVQDEMWPDAEGDRAERAFTIALHRLRALLGDASLVRRRAGRVSLDGARVFVDAWAIERWCVHVLQADAPSEMTRRATGRIRALYRGPLLELEPWAEQARDRLVRTVDRALSRWPLDSR